MRRGNPVRAPLVHRDGEREQVPALGREPVFVAGRMLLVQVLLDHARRQQAAQAVGEDVGRDAERRVDVVVAVQAEEQRADQQGGPAIADGVHAVEHRRVDAVPRRGHGAFAPSRRAQRGGVVLGARPRLVHEIAPVDGLIAMGADDRRVQRLAARGVHETRRQAELAAPAVLPDPHAERDRVERQSLLGQPVFEAARRIAIGPAVQQAGIDHRVESGRQRAPRRAGAASQVLEPAHAEERVAHQQVRPAITHEVQRAGHLAAAQQFTDGLDILGARRSMYGFSGRHVGARSRGRDEFNILRAIARQQTVHGA